jgi:tetratricopeptide (TPR) repeat protein
MWGNYYYKIKQFEKAEEQYIKAIQLDSNIALIRIGYGNILAAAERYGEAEEQLIKSIELDSTHSLSYSGLGIVYVRTNRPQEAVEQFIKAIRINNGNSNVYHNLGYAYLQIKEYIKAEEAFIKCIQLDSTSVEAYNDLGRIYLNRFQYIKAEKFFKKAIKAFKSSPKLWIPYSNLGIVYQQTGLWEDAATMTQKAIELFPNDGGLHAELAYALSNIPSRLGESKTNFEKAIALNPEWPDTYLFLAHFLKRHPFAMEGSGATSVSQYLQQAFKKGIGENGVINQKDLLRRPDLAILRAEPIWNELMQKHFPDQQKK